MGGRRLNEVVAMGMIGDGVLAVLQPERHCRLWEFGPRGYRAVIRWCAEHPAATRLMGAAEIALGIWLGANQQPAAEGRDAREAEKPAAEPESSPARAAA